MGCEARSVVECLLSMHKALGSIPYQKKKKKEEEEEKLGSQGRGPKEDVCSSRKLRAAVLLPQEDQEP